MPVLIGAKLFVDRPLLSLLLAASAASDQANAAQERPNGPRGRFGDGGPLAKRESYPPEIAAAPGMDGLKSGTSMEYVNVVVDPGAAAPAQ